MHRKILLLLTLSFLLLGSSVMGTDLEEIKRAIRKKGAKWEAAETWISKLSPEERRRLLGDNLADEFSGAPGVQIGRVKDLPTELDWRNKDGHFWLTPVKDQKYCGSCTAFGACAALEGNIKIYARNYWIMPDLSEQHLFSCAGGDCDTGMSISTAMNYFLNYGVPREDCLPYAQRDDNCSETCADWQEMARKISNWGWTDGTISSTKSALYNYGPIEGHFYVYEDFFYYHGGVYQHVSGDYAGRHAIAIVGYSDTDSCWICKNSWGPNWGEYGPYPDSTKGWFRIKYGECGIESRKAAWMVPVVRGSDGIVLDKGSFHFVLPPDSAAEDSLHVSNVGDSAFIFGVASPQPWLFVSPQVDTLSSNEVSGVAVLVNTSALLGGVYAGTLAVSASDFGPGEVPLYKLLVPISLEVDVPFIRGDYDGDGQVLTNDPLMELQFIFGVPGATPPSCDDAADYDDNGNIFTNDPLMALQSIFGVPGSVPPQPPYPDCGSDPTEDGLYCGIHAFCVGGKGLAYKPAESLAGAENKLVAGEPMVADGLVRIPVELTVTEPVCGLDISLGYDTGTLRYERVEGGEGYDFWAVDTREAGVVRIGAVPDIEMAKLLEPGTHRVGEVVFELEKRGDLGLRWQRAEVYGARVQPLSLEWVVKAGGGRLPTQFALEQNYPNPFNSTTLIRYAIPQATGERSKGKGVSNTSYLIPITLEVYNIVGEKVATLVDEKQAPGYRQVKWDARDIASGIYFYRLTGGGFTSVHKMVLLK